MPWLGGGPRGVQPERGIGEMKVSLLTGVLLAGTMAGTAHAEQRQESALQESAQCVLYIEQQDQQLHVRNPVCFDAKGGVWSWAVLIAS